MNFREILPPIKSFQFFPLRQFVEPEIMFSYFWEKSYSSLLCGKGAPDNSRFGYIGINPFLKVSHNGIQAQINFDNREINFAFDPFQLFGEILKYYSVKTYPFPISCWGAIGYFSYDAAHFIEKLPRTTIDDLNMPVMEMVYYQDFFLFDYQEKTTFLVQVDIGNGFNDTRQIMNIAKKGMNPIGGYKVDVPQSYCSEKEYVLLVKKIIDYIKKGDVYEVNLSHRFEANYQGDPYGIFFNLFRINPAPFSGFLNFGENVIISNSPERFLKVEEDRVETRPIKGTINRGKTEEEDEKNLFSLIHSEKDEAELSMIVDLLRNDLGKVCEWGSIRVREHKRVEGFSNVWHLISIVEGKMRKGEDHASLVRACFPGGSITGCPKIRSMEIIDELERFARNIYTGMIFIGNDYRLDSNIVIRTIIAKKDRLYFSVGGAVVFDSIPEKEYKETIGKAQSIIKALL